MKSCVHMQTKLVDRYQQSPYLPVKKTYVIEPVDQDSNIAFCLQKYNYGRSIKEFVIFNISGNSTYRNTSFDKDDILANLKSLVFLAMTTVFRLCVFSGTPCTMCVQWNTMCDVTS